MKHKSLAGLFLAAGALLVFTVVVAYVVGLEAVQANRQVAVQTTVILRLEGLMSTLKDAETGQRGFLLTGRENYLQPYQDAVQQLGNEQAALKALAEQRELQPRDLATLQELIQARMRILVELIEMRRTNFSGAVELMMTDDGKRIMDNIRMKVAAMEQVENEELERALNSARWSVVARTATFGFTALVNLVFLAWVYRRLMREIARRETAANELVRQKELLGTTLASIGDGVIVTDSAGRVTFLNAEAERLTGWKNLEADGQALPSVFRIINEHTREPVENPVEKVLRLRVVVGLANHTILISKTGEEIPIDDSAAPIMSLDGTFFGVVLVFRDFREQRQAQQALARSKEELELLVAVRTAKLTEMVAELQQMSYAMVHDMRAPLRAMSGFAGAVKALCDEGLDPEMVRENCNRIIIGANRLDRLITDALCYTKSVLQESPRQRVELSRLLKGILETYPNLAPDKAEIVIENELPAVMGEESLLTQVFANLLGNAVKFVSPGSRPKVRVWAQWTEAETAKPKGDGRGPSGGQTRIRIWVEDNGIGIPKNAQGRLFGIFQKLDNMHEGTGIGLAIVRKAAERMGGKVGAESEVGKGSRFWVELLPAERVAA